MKLITRRLPLRDAVEYRPSLDNMEVRSEPFLRSFTKLKDFSTSVFTSQFWIPAQHVDYYRDRFPEHDPSFSYGIKPFSRQAIDFPFNQPGWLHSFLFCIHTSLQSNCPPFSDSYTKSSLTL